jgi:hypothetical protein
MSTARIPRGEMHVRLGEPKIEVSWSVLLQGPEYFEGLLIGSFGAVVGDQIEANAAPISWAK